MTFVFVFPWRESRFRHFGSGTQLVLTLSIIDDVDLLEIYMCMLYGQTLVRVPLSVYRVSAM